MATITAAAGGPVLLTGATNFLGRRLLLELAQAGRPVFLLAQPEELPQAHAAVARVTRRHPAARGAVLLFAGDVLEPGLGLSGEVADRVIGEATVFVHALRFGPGPRRNIERAAMDNVRAVESLLSFAHRCRGLESFVLVSSTAVAGDYPGTFYEDWFDVGQGFADPLDRSVFEMEARVREARRTVPLVVVRPGAMPIDAGRGEVDPADGLGLLVRALGALRRLPPWVPLPTLEGARSIVPLTPVDFAARAILALSALREFRGHAYCLVDPTSPTWSELVTTLAGLVGAPVPRWTPAARVQGAVLRLPGVLPALARAGDALGLPLRRVRLLLSRNRHDTRRAATALEPLGIRCPPFAEWAPRLATAWTPRAA